MSKQTHKVTLRIPMAMQDRILEIAKRRGPGAKQIDLWQEAMRKFIDEQEDVIGSRAHFHHSMRERLQDLQDDLMAEIPKAITAKLAEKLEFFDADLYTTRRLLEALLLIEAAHWARIDKKDAGGKEVDELLTNAISAADDGKFRLNQIMRFR